MGKREKRKGSKGELEVAKLLRAWWITVEPQTEDGASVVFVRTPSSGGWAYGPSFKACGDIMTNAMRFPFGVEVKRVESWSLQVLLACKPSPVWGFWRQCQYDAGRIEREPLLWFKQNRQPWLVMMRKRYAVGVGAERPDIVFPNELRSIVDCETVPVVFFGDRFLAHDPMVFAR